MATENDGEDNSFDPEELVQEVTDEEVIEQISDIAQDANYDVLEDNLETGRGIVPDQKKKVFKITNKGSNEAYVHIAQGTKEDEYTLQVAGISTIIIDEEVFKSGSSFNIFYKPTDNKPRPEEDYLYIEVTESRGGEIKFEEHKEDSLQNLERDSRKFSSRLRCRGCRRFTKVSKTVGEEIAPIAVCYIGNLAIASYTGIEVDSLIELLNEGSLAVMTFFGFDQDSSDGLSQEIRGEVKMLCPRIVSGILMDAAGYIRKLPGSNRSFCERIRFC